MPVEREKEEEKQGFSDEKNVTRGKFVIESGFKIDGIRSKYLFLVFCFWCW